MAIGASTMAEKKAIVTHLTALQEIASMKVLCSDKTGTLTTANMTIITEKIWAAEGFTQEQVLPLIPRPPPPPAFSYFSLSSFFVLLSFS